MRTDYLTLRAAMSACGLEQKEAAKFLGVRPDTFRKAISGKTPTPPGWLLELAELSDTIQSLAENAMSELDNYPEDIPIDFGLATDDHEAEDLGLPFASCHAKVAEIIWVHCANRMTVVPRGSTVSTAAAEEFRKPSE